jgi:cytidylate kinase
MYRAVGLWALRLGVDLSDMHRLEQLAKEAHIELQTGSSRVLLNGEDITEAIRTQEISDAASKASVIPGVRRAMVEKQRQMSTQASVVMEGRDIGSVVFPKAEVKLFLDADPAVRADRRLREIKEKGEIAEADEIVRQIKERDERDRTRSEAPLVQAPDAVYIDSTALTVEEVEEAILKVIRERISNGKDFSN